MVLVRSSAPCSCWISEKSEVEGFPRIRGSRLIAVCTGAIQLIVPGTWGPFLFIINQLEPTVAQEQQEMGQV